MNKIALITGSSKGIGFETARKLLLKGFKVVVTARTATKAQTAVRKLNSPNVSWIEMDSSATESIKKALTAFTSIHSHLDVLINNAAIYQDPTESILESTAPVILEHFQNNTLGPLLVCQAFMPLLLKSDQPRIINVSSGYGSLFEMRAHAPGYSISKTALNAVTRQLAALETKVSTNSVCPGWVQTDMGGPNATRSVEKGAETIVWLASDAPQNLTGKFFRDKKEINW